MFIFSSPVLTGEVPAGRRGSSQMTNSKEYRENKRPTALSRGQARKLRREMSPPERLLWSALRGKQVAGLKFRKQAPIGVYIADFYCHEARLVVEVDGGSHCGDRLDHDQKRDRWMHEQGIHVLRVQARDVFENLDGVVRAIRRDADRS